MKILKFTSSWCGACVIFDREVISKYQGNIPIETIDIDKNLDLSSKYRIDFVPTCIFVDDNNKEIKRIVGLISFNDFLLSIAKEGVE
jgi:thiol-disulfide isomerase/thioredoxin